MKVVGLVTTTRPEKLQVMLDSLSDCDDIIVMEDKDRRGVAWARNQLIDLAPPNCIVRFVDDDDIAFSTRRMAERLLENNVDALAASYITQGHRIVVPSDPVTACINRIAPWSWVAKIDSIRSLRWDDTKKVMMGTWQWLKFIENDLKLGMAPDIWCYHWIPAADGITADHASTPTFDLYRKLLDLIRSRGNRADLLHLVNRMSFYDRTFKEQYQIRDHHDPYLYDKLDTYINTGGNPMIASRKQALTPSQCASIIAAAEQVNFRKAQVRNTDGSSSYSDVHRQGMVCFLRPDDLSAETWGAVQHAVTSMNEQYYNGVVDTLDLQVAEYASGQIGFDWHNDDPPYPSDDLIWSGRKLTCVFELSDPTTYSGGYLEIQPYRTMRHDPNIFSKSQEIIAKTLQNLNASQMSVQGNKIEFTINDDEIPSISSTSISPVQSTNDSREWGEATMFPSFFYHKVHPVVEGKRYSLTVWAKGPLWV